MHKLLLLVLAIATFGCSSRGDGDVEARIVAALRPNWPGVSDAELADKARPFVENCTGKFNNEKRTSMRMAIDLSPAMVQILRVGCPERVAKLETP